MVILNPDTKFSKYHSNDLRLILIFPYLNIIFSPPHFFSPSPSSMSPGGRSKDGRQPGTLHGDRLTPSVPAIHPNQTMYWKKYPGVSYKLQTE